MLVDQAALIIQFSQPKNCVSFLELISFKKYAVFLTQNIDVDVFVNILQADKIGSVAAVVSGVRLPQILDRDALRSDDSVLVIVCILDGLPVVDPLDLGGRVAVGLALEDDRFALGGSLELGLRDEARLSFDLQMDGVRLGQADTVGRLAGVVASVLEVHVLDDKDFAVVVVGGPAPG